MTLAESYEPYSSVLTSTGTASSIFGYAGEQLDTTGLIYLRARYLNPRLGIFLAHDPWSGDVLQPGSMNGFNYVEGNPVNLIDPSGEFTQLLGNLPACNNLAKRSCAEIAVEIARVIAELSKRADDLIHDPLNLPRTGQNMSIESHRDRFEKTQVQLRKLIKEWNSSGCGGNPPGDAWGWATMAAPWPRPKLPGSKFEPALQSVPVTEPGEPAISSSDIATGKTLNIQIQIQSGSASSSGVASPATGSGPSPTQAAQTAGQITFWAGVVYLIYNLKGCVLGPIGCVVDLLTPVP